MSSDLGFYPQIETVFGKIEAAPESEPTRSGASSEHLTKEVKDLETSVAKAADGESARRKTIAVGYLRMTKQRLDQAHRDIASAYNNQSTYVRLGRQYGLTNQAIGDLLGVTEARVRQIAAGD